MRKFQLMFATLALCALSACATFGVPTPQTFNQRVAVVTSAITDVETAATTLLVSKKLSVSDAQNIQTQALGLLDGIRVARTLYAASPQSGDDKLAALSKALSALQAYLKQQQGTGGVK